MVRPGGMLEEDVTPPQVLLSCSNSVISSGTVDCQLQLSEEVPLLTKDIFETNENAIVGFRNLIEHRF